MERKTDSNGKPYDSGYNSDGEEVNYDVNGQELDNVDDDGNPCTNEEKDENDYAEHESD